MVEIKYQRSDGSVVREPESLEATNFVAKIGRVNVSLDMDVFKNPIDACNGIIRSFRTLPGAQRYSSQKGDVVGEYSTFLQNVINHLSPQNPNYDVIKELGDVVHGAHSTGKKVFEKLFYDNNYPENQANKTAITKIRVEFKNKSTAIKHDLLNTPVKVSNPAVENELIP